MSQKGLDVSEFQGTIDWTQVQSAGYQFALLRAGYGFGTVDRQFHRNAAECNRLGIPVGAYWFCYAISPETARQEADGCLDAISSHRFDYPICYDIEQATLNYAAQNGVTITPQLAAQIVTAFCNRLEEHGYFAMYYSNRNFLTQYLPSDFSDRYALWYAYYNEQFDGTSCGIWQYTNEGTIPGISGNVDLDAGFIDYPTIIRTAGLNHLSDAPVSPSPEPEPPDYITYIIQPGDTLSQLAVRFGTTVNVLASLNDLTDPDLIYAGQTLRIPENADASILYYTVQPGDTLSQIALQYRTTVNALAALNHLADPNLIYAGQILRIS